jgi:dinuclear metal center YbgI/SA1388 family protein
MNLNQVVKRLTEYANLNLACDWDNVGLLVEPSGPVAVEKILVTNDLTEPVLDEAIKHKINLIVTYHPAIFHPLKRLTQKEWKQRSIIKCIENKIAVYSPHTSWDSVNGGINDWLINQFGPKSVEPVETLISSSHPSGFSKTVKVCLNEKSKESFLETINKANNIMRLDNNTDDLEFLTSPAGVVEIIENIKNIDSLALNTLRIYDLTKVSSTVYGNGMGLFF